MRPLLSTSQSLELDAFTREMFDFPSDNLMEIAAMRLWQVLKCELIRKRLPQTLPTQTSIAAVCGKGDNAGDALAMLRHARLEGFQHLSALVPGAEALKENAQLNLRRAERCGIEIVRYASAEEPALLELLSRQDIVLDAVLGTGAHGRAKGSAAGAIHLLEALYRGRAKSVGRASCIVAIDIPSGLGDDWQPDYPVVHADATLCIEPLKEALYMPAARPCAGDILPVGGIFPLWTEAATSDVWLLEDGDVRNFLPPISPWAHKMQRGRVAVLAGSQSGAGAALHCVRGAAAAGAGYIALYCDEALFPSYLAAAGDLAIVRVLSRNSFSPESWDAVVVGPGWGVAGEREAQLDSLLHSDTALVLDADCGPSLCANRGQESCPFFQGACPSHPSPRRSPGTCFVARAGRDGGCPECFGIGAAVARPRGKIRHRPRPEGIDDPRRLSGRKVRGLRRKRVRTGGRGVRRRAVGARRRSSCPVDSSLERAWGSRVQRRGYAVSHCPGSGDTGCRACPRQRRQTAFEDKRLVYACRARAGLCAHDFRERTWMRERRWTPDRQEPGPFRCCVR